MVQQLHIQPSEIGNFEYYVFEEYIKLLNEHNKEQSEENKQNQNNMPNMPDPSKYMQNMPKFNIPKL